jgi:glycerol dehydrogenase-like iron-containing ADH family enzyme
MQLPREVIIGEGVINRVAEIFRRLGFTESALIITGFKTEEVAGKTVRAILENEGLRVETLRLKQQLCGM